MEHLEEAIKIAKENGFTYNDGDYTLAQDSILLSPLFWKSLAKGLGAGNEGNTTWSKNQATMEHGVAFPQNSWQALCFLYIDHIMKGYDGDEFFKALLKRYLWI